MLRTYEAIIQDGQVKWLAEKPDIKSGRVFISVLEDRSMGNPTMNHPAASGRGIRLKKDSVPHPCAT